MPTLQKKVCLLGDFAVGKTSLVRRFVYNRFDDKYISSIGVKVSRKTVAITHVDEVVEITMMLWDLAGSEEFSRMRASYLRGAAGAILVGDLTRPETFESLRVYVRDMRRLNPNAYFVLAANKHDLNNQIQLSQKEIASIAAEFGIAYCLTSAKTGDKVEALFRHLANLLITP